MIQADMHMHTWFSTDSEACPRDMADEAVRKGLKTICFTDHFDKDDLAVSYTHLTLPTTERV